MECFGTTDFDNNSRLITLSAIIISGLHCIIISSKSVSQMAFCLQSCSLITSHLTMRATYPIPLIPLDLITHLIILQLSPTVYHALFFFHVRISPKCNFYSLTLRRLMSYIYGAPILDVSRSHTTTHHSR